jgi:hypothetical protein
MTFVKIARNVSGKIPAELRICPDQYVGTISEFGHNCSASDFLRQPTACRPKELECLLLILESPHVQEFEGKLGPAKGNTGNLIRKWIADVVGCEYRSHGLILINAIQHQCSLGLPTRCFRDEVFEIVWSRYGAKNFLERVEKIYQEGDVVMNCCTRGKQKTELRQLVQDVILGTAISPEHRLRRTHPSSWFSEKKRQHIWQEEAFSSRKIDNSATRKPMA